MNTNSKRLTQKQAWFHLVRPRTLTLSTIPVVVGLALASTVTYLHWNIALCTWLFALCIQIAANVFNDALDFKNGVDVAGAERLGPPRMTQSGYLTVKQVLLAGYAVLAAAALFGIPLIDRGGWPMMLLLGLSAALAYAYTGGPFPISYLGLTEIFVLVFFGLAATGATYFLQTGHLSAAALLAGAQIGLLAILPIPINNLRDHHGDAKGNKRTLVVRFGVSFGKQEVAVVTLLPYLLNILWIPYGYSWAAVLPFITLPVAIQLIRELWAIEKSSEYNKMFLKSMILHAMFGIFLIVGICLV